MTLEIGARPDITATKLARSLGVTKGAVSQTVARLVGKGLLLKTPAPAGRNALRLEFTTLGAQTVAHFRERTAALRAGVEEHVAGLSDDERAVVAAFLDRLTRALEDLGRA